jgi:signal transduction histidine kinase
MRIAHPPPNRTRLRQLFENVVRNAVEHGGPDVTVRVGALPDENGFYVEDDGVPLEDREALVASGPATGRHRGLGLRIVTQVVEAHGWSIHLTGSNGGGARFELSGVEFV